MRLRASFPELLKARNGWPDVTRFGDFRDRYCRLGRKKLPNGERIPVVLGGKNETELRLRIAGTFLRRAQADVGIQPPRYETLPLVVSAAERARFAETPNERKILTAAAAGKTYDLEMELGSLWRQTGVVKARAVVEAIREQMRLGLEKIVLAYWHRDVGDILEEGLRSFGLVRLDGSTSPTNRESCEKRFRAPSNRIFLGQIQSAGEAIDLSPADEMWLVEYAMSPRLMEQVSKRIVNVEKKRNCFVRVVTIDQSIDDKIGERLLSLWQSINGVVGK
jgi:SNF2 family DNA or RNA helicase